MLGCGIPRAKMEGDACSSLQTQNEGFSRSFGRTARGQGTGSFPSPRYLNVKVRLARCGRQAQEGAGRRVCWGEGGDVWSVHLIQATCRRELVWGHLRAFLRGLPAGGTSLELMREVWDVHANLGVISEYVILYRWGWRRCGGTE